MTPNSNTKAARKGVWRLRGRRLMTGLNVLVAVCLAGVMTFMINYLGARYYRHWNISWENYYGLSDKTRNMLAGLDADVSVTAVFQKGNELCQDVHRLLKEYEYECARLDNIKLTVEFVDPDRDLAKARELRQRYDLRRSNVVIFETADRKKYVEGKDIVDYKYTLRGRQAIKKMVGFKGEQVFSSAIQSIVQATSPTVYFLTGHGERDIEDFGQQAGYSILARALRRDNMNVKTLLLAKHRRVPDDCSAIVIAGPDTRLSNAEIDLLSGYLDKNGRIMCLIDPAVTTGLEKLLGKWGVKVGPGVVVGLTLTGRELVVTHYGNHPVTRNVKQVTTMFYMPRPVEPLAASAATSETHADKPRVTILAINTDEGWLEANLNQSPPRYDAGIDRPGPVGIAVAVEKGAVSGIDVEIKPTRMVVIGDSYFVSNRALSGGVGGNSDFFMSALNWLLERESLMAIAPKDPMELRLDMNQKQIRTAYLILVLAVPACVALLGTVVWWRRRI